MLPPALCYTLLCNFALVMNKTLAGNGWCNDWAIDTLFVCRAV